MKKLSTLLNKLKEPTRICKICFQPIHKNSIRTLIDSDASLCEKCRKKFEPKFINFSCGRYKALSIYNYDPTIQGMLYQFKGCYDFELSKVFLEPYYSYLRIKYYGYIIVPIPSYDLEDIKREFNHVVEIFSFLKLPIYKVLVKTDNYKQSSQKHSDRNQIINYLKLSDSNIIKNKKILIVDDVYTTGSTMKAAISLIEKCHPKDIKVLVLSKTIIHNQYWTKMLKALIINKH